MQGEGAVILKIVAAEKSCHLAFRRGGNELAWTETYWIVFQIKSQQVLVARVQGQGVGEEEQGEGVQNLIWAA